MWILEKYDSDWIDLTLMPRFFYKNESSDSMNLRKVLSASALGHSWRTYVALAQNGARHRLTSRTSVSVLWRVCVCVCVCVCMCVYIYIYIHTHTHTHTSDCVQIVCEPLVLQIAMRVKQFYTNFWLDIFFFSLGRRAAGDWANTWRRTKCFSLLFKQELVAVPLTSRFSSLSRS